MKVWGECGMEGKQRIAFVTGTDHGVGLWLVKVLLLRGYRVIAGRIRPEEHLIDELQKEYPELLSIIELDIGIDASVAGMRAYVERNVPHIDLLINNAGILGDMKKNIEDELDYEEIQRVINVNAVGTLRVTNALFDKVIQSEQKTILNISSEAGSITDCFREGWFGYGMSKAANNMQSALVHNNIKKYQGRVIVMHPGHVATYMRGHLDTTASLTAEESATAVLATVLDGNLPDEDRPLYINYRGDRLPW